VAQAVELELHKQMSERRRVEAAEAQAAAEAERGRTATAAADRADVLEHASRELAVAHARAAALEARACTRRRRPSPIFRAVRAILTRARARCRCVSAHQARVEALAESVAAANAERGVLRAAAAASEAHAAERDRLREERQLLDAVARQQADLIARQVRARALKITRHVSAHGSADFVLRFLSRRFPARLPRRTPLPPSPPPCARRWPPRTRLLTR
jgi:hypothetical protein